MVIRIEVHIEILKSTIIIEITIIEDKQMNASMLKKINLCCLDISIIYKYKNKLKIF